MLRSCRALGLLVALLSALIVQADNTRSTALSIQPNGSANDSISPGGDVDYWRLELASRGELEVWTSGNLDTVGVIENHQGNELALDDGGGRGYNFNISGIAETGVYYVRVYSYDAEETGPYTLHMRFAPEIGPTTQDCTECPEMVSIPGGTFRMGDLSGEGEKRERPVHSVTVPAFKMGKYEVTFAQWNACVADGGCGGYRPNDEGWGRGNWPAIYVSWDDAQLYIQWLNAKTGGNYRLPSEAEWEYAARVWSTTKYSRGNDIGRNRANCSQNRYYGCRDSYENTAPVGSFPANALGLHDMHGNVWEWVQDCRNDSYHGAPSDGSAWTSGDCSYRLLRGGSWTDYEGILRSAFRSWDTRPHRGYSLGFRLVQDN